MASGESLKPVINLMDACFVHAPNVNLAELDSALFLSRINQVCSCSFIVVK